MPVPLALTSGSLAGIGPDITLAAWRRRVECALAPFYLLADPDAHHPPRRAAGRGRAHLRGRARRGKRRHSGILFPWLTSAST